MANNNNKNLQSGKSVLESIQNADQPAFERVQHNAERSKNVEMNSADANVTGVTNPNRANQ
nr:hypothetical protein [Neobacillus sp. Marseille-Q6967]